jgi:hypothetical protein
MHPQSQKLQVIRVHQSSYLSHVMQTLHTGTVQCHVVCTLVPRELPLTDI